MKRLSERLFGPFSWPHQVAQVVVSALGCAGAWRWYGWPAAAVVATTATAVSLLALLEARTLRRRVIELPCVHTNG